MVLEDASLTGSIGLVRIKRIGEDGCFPNEEGEDDNGRESL